VLEKGVRVCFGRMGGSERGVLTAELPSVDIL
jgi:hypothetical protein